MPDPVDTNDKWARYMRAGITVIALYWAFTDWHYIPLFALLAFDDEIGEFLARKVKPKKAPK